MLNYREEILINYKERVSFWETLLVFLQINLFFTGCLKNANLSREIFYLPVKERLIVTTSELLPSLKGGPHTPAPEVTML